MIDQIRKIPKEKFPQHIAIIMDGNRRWAVEKGYPKFYGHKKGIDTVKTVVKAAKKIGVKYLTLYAFSTENWKRSDKEVSTLMALLKQAIKTYTPELLENDVSLKISGRVQEFSSELKKEIDKSVLKLSKCSSMVLNLALNYGGRSEIVDAVNKCLKNGLTEITEKDINDNLYTHPLPDPNLIIRTSGEMRISNFLIWQSAYSEFFVTSKYWPDFDEKDLFEAVINYSKRERRMGR